MTAIVGRDNIAGTQFHPEKARPWAWAFSPISSGGGHDPVSAIDLKDGQCVRLKLGDMAEATVFNDDPAAQARIFEQPGFSWLHWSIQWCLFGQGGEWSRCRVHPQGHFLAVQLGGASAAWPISRHGLRRESAGSSGYGGAARSRPWWLRPAACFRAASRWDRCQGRLGCGRRLARDI